MIEFRAACGHSIRAREEDAGKTVTCNFCGATIQVPDSTGSALDYLFTEVEEAQQRSAGNDAVQIRDSGPPIPIIGNLIKQNDPVKLVMTFVYIGIVLIVVGVGGRYLYQSVVKPIFASEGKSSPIADKGPDSPPGPDGTSDGGPPDDTSSAGKPKGGGRPYPMLAAGVTGIYVTSIPAGADVFMRTLAEDDNAAVKIGKDPKENKGKTPLMISDSLDPGEYVIAVGVTSANQDLMRLPEYTELRRALRGDEEQRVGAESFFIPDGSKSLRVDHPPGAPPIFVREFRVAVRNGRWSPVCSYFLPDAELSDLVQYLPKKREYNIDEDRLGAEFDLYDVAEKDRPLVLKVIENVGTAIYKTSDGRFQVLQLLPDPNEFFNGFTVPRQSGGG
jgi:hypothetical protein